MKHSKEVPACFLPPYLANFLGLHGSFLKEFFLSLHPPGLLLHCPTETGAWQQWVLPGELTLLAGALSKVNFWGNGGTGAYMVDATRDSSSLRLSFAAVHPASKQTHGCKIISKV